MRHSRCKNPVSVTPGLGRVLVTQYKFRKNVVLCVQEYVLVLQQDELDFPLKLFNKNALEQSFHLRVTVETKASLIEHPADTAGAWTLPSTPVSWRLGNKHPPWTSRLVASFESFDCVLV